MGEVRSIMIMVVDDDPLIRRMLTRALARAGYIPLSEDSPVAAMEIIMSGVPSFDLVISDFRMVGMDGFTFADKLRDGGFTKPIILFTGLVKSLKDGLEEMKRSGKIQGFLGKPSTIDEILAAVKAALGDDKSAE